MTTLSYDTAKKLKDAGFPQDHDCIDGKDLRNGMVGNCLCVPYLPTLSELIEACGEEFHCLVYTTNGGMDCDRKFWSAGTTKFAKDMQNGTTPEEAVAELWIVTKGTKQGVS